MRRKNASLVCGLKNVNAKKMKMAELMSTSDHNP